jgi:hypothetical protein
MWWAGPIADAGDGEVGDVELGVEECQEVVK